MKAWHLKHLASAAALAAASLFTPLAQAGPYSQMFVFGDSVSDGGNVALAIGYSTGVLQAVSGNTYIPDYPYYPSGRFSNGPVWAEAFADRLGVSAAPSLAGGTNFAWAGARTGGPDVPVPTLTTQAGQFLAATHDVAPSGALYVIAEVGNDARDALALIGGGVAPATAIQSAATAYADRIGTIVDKLRNAGAQHFLVFDNVNLGLVPAITSLGAGVSGLASTVTTSMNGALSLRLASEAGVTLFDTFAFLSGVVQQPGDFGFSNATDACGAVVAADCSRYVFWDGLHPTASMHAAIAQAAYDRVTAAVPEPQTSALFAVGGLALLLARRRLWLGR